MRCGLLVIVGMLGAVLAAAEPPPPGPVPAPPPAPAPVPPAPTPAPPAAAAAPAAAPAPAAAAPHPMLGITVDTNAGGDVPFAGAPPAAPVVVAMVVPGTTAARCGIRVHDTILRINDVAISSFAALVAALHTHHIGDHVTIVVRRAGQERVLQGVLRGPPPPPGEAPIIP